MWEIEYTDEFGEWWDFLTEIEQTDIGLGIELLEQLGPNLRFPYSSGIKGSRHSHLRELRIQHQGEPYRVLYAFDPRRIAILLIGGCKKGDDRWYEKYAAKADKLYNVHLESLKIEELI